MKKNYSVHNITAVSIRLEGQSSATPNVSEHTIYLEKLFTLGHILNQPPHFHCPLDGHP